MPERMSAIWTTMILAVLANIAMTYDYFDYPMDYDPDNDAQPEPPPEPEEVKQPDAIPDAKYDVANFFELISWGWRDDDPLLGDVEYVDDNVLEWSFAYTGGENAQKRSNNPAERGLVWAMAIIGIDPHYRVYPVSAMGVLVHPRILMTLCASVNSYYKSYKGILLERDATRDKFKISNSSDAQFDIRTPTLLAYMTSRYGFLSLNGTEDIMAISRTLIPNDKCLRAVTANEPVGIVQQYKSVAFLLLKSPMLNPLDPDLPVHYDFLRPNREDKMPIELLSKNWRTRPDVPLELMAYRTRPCDWSKKHNTKLKVWRVPGSKDSRVEPNLHLLNTRWSESTVVDPVQTKGGCLSALDEFLCSQPLHLWHKLTGYFGCNLGDFYKLSKSENTPYKEALAGVIFNQDVACMNWYWGNLCDAPAGSPLFYFKDGEDVLVGLAITSPKTDDFAKMSESNNIFVLLVTPDGGRYEIQRELHAAISLIDALAAEKLRSKDYPDYSGIKETERILLEVKGYLDPVLVPEIDPLLRLEAGTRGGAGRTYSVPSLIPVMLLSGGSFSSE